MEVTTSTNMHIHAHTLSPAVNQPTSQPLHQSVSLHQASRDFEHCKKQVPSLSATTAPTVRATFRGNLRTQWMWSPNPNLAAQLWKASVSHILKGFLEVETSEFFETLRATMKATSQGPVWHVSQLRLLTVEARRTCNWCGKCCNSKSNSVSPWHRKTIPMLSWMVWIKQVETTGWSKFHLCKL